MMTSKSTPLLVLTGAGGGMGTAVTSRFLRDGWRVLAVDRTPDPGRSRQGYYSLVTDLSQPEAAEDISSRAVELGGLQAVVHLAGVSYGEKGLGAEEDFGWEHSLAVNATSPMRINRRLAPVLCAQGSGSIVHVSSPVGIVGANKPAYAASKAAMHGLSMSFARACGPHGVRVNTLLPGTTITGMTSDWPDEKRQAVASDNFFKRLCTSEEIAGVIAFLCGPDSRYITGSIVDMTAGGLWGH